LVEPKLDPHARGIFREALRALQAADARFVVAGAFATFHYTGFWRNTKDLDLFCMPADAAGILEVLSRVGFTTHVEEKHWLGKAVRQDVLVDVIWGGGNWATFVDEHWFDHAVDGKVLEVPVLVAPASDMILSKAWVAGRERFDGADIAHLIRACGHNLDWDDLVERFGDHWALLLHYLVLYRFVFPAERDLVPTGLIHELAARIGTEDEVRDGLPFRGPLVDRYAYLHDLAGGLPDPRIEIARRAGYPEEAVDRRRELDAEALEQGLPYGQATAFAE
jgi:hypothetical protein